MDSNNTTANAVDQQTENKNVEFLSEVNVPLEVREAITKKIEELKAQHHLRKIYAMVLEGEEGDTKPLYIAYFQRPSLMHFSKYMSFVQKDLVQANKMLAQDVFLAGDKELIDDDELFLYGTMPQLSHLIDSRNGELVKR